MSSSLYSYLPLSAANATAPGQVADRRTATAYSGTNLELRHASQAGLIPTSVVEMYIDKYFMIFTQKNKIHE